MADGQFLPNVPMKLIRWLITGSYAAFIFYLSSRPWVDIPPPFPYFDKVFHFLLYLGLGGFCVWTLRVTSLKGRAGLPYLAAVMAAIYGITDEIHQLYVPGRTASVADLAADAAGAIVGAIIAIRLARWMRRKTL